MSLSNNKCNRVSMWQPNKLGENLLRNIKSLLYFLGRYWDFFDGLCWFSHQYLNLGLIELDISRSSELVELESSSEPCSGLEEWLFITGVRLPWLLRGFWAILTQLVVTFPVTGWSTRGVSESLAQIIVWIDFAERNVSCHWSNFGCLNERYSFLGLH